MKGILARYYVKKALKKAYFNPLLITKEDVDNYLEPLCSAAGRRGISSVANALYNEDAETTSQNYKDIKCPVLIIWGEMDEILPIEVLNRLKNEIYNVKVNLIPECGHVPQEEKPEVVCGSITRFVWS